MRYELMRGRQLAFLGAQWFRISAQRTYCSMAKIHNMPTQGGRSCAKGLHRKVWNLEPLHTLFCRDIKICRNLHTFRKFLAKKCFIGSKAVFLGQQVDFYMVYSAYFTELNLQFCKYAQKRHICRKIIKYASDDNFYGHFCFRRGAANFCYPVPAYEPYSMSMKTSTIYHVNNKKIAIS